MIKVLMCGNHPSNKGGMTSVISQIMSYNWEKQQIKMKFIPTFYPANNIVKIGYFVLSYLRILFAFLVYRPDIVHMHMSYKGSFQRKYFIHKLCKRFGVKDMIHLHGSEFEKWYEQSSNRTKQKIKALLRECDIFFVLGEKWKAVVKRIEPTVNAVVLHNAVALPEEIVQWNEQQCQILYMGVLIPRKGLDVLLEAFSVLKDLERLGNLRLAIAGTGSEETNLKTFCKEKGLDNVVDFYGWVSGQDKKDLLLNSQIMVLPSYNEGLPICILEAISYGMPVIATDVGDMPFAVHDGENGYLIRPGEIPILANKLELLKDEKRFRKMSEKSRRLAEKDFSEEKFYEQLLKCYFELTRVEN